ncbi:MAG: hypothetical protein MUD10_05465 [Candidatus Pacebacteria bacterium]|jgi:uncharacterized membrane protein|nr:hypothetical protein [Candidatus Paceibacterota bacterium]
MEKEIKEETAKNVEKKPVATAREKNTGMAIIAYIVFFIPLLTEAKGDAFVKYHVKQGMVLFVAWIASGFVGMVPLFGWMIAPLLSLAMLILMILGIINAANGVQKPLPLIGAFADQIKLPG